MKASELIWHLKRHIEKYGDSEVDIECELVPFELDFYDIEPVHVSYDTRYNPYCTFRISKLL